VQIARVDRAKCCNVVGNSDVSTLFSGHDVFQIDKSCGVSDGDESNADQASFFRHPI
jgi:hypothetical protein